MPLSPYVRRLREHVGNELLLIASAGVVVRDGGGRVLLVKDADSGHLTIIGGAIEIDESPEEAAVREAGEEANITVRTTRLLGVAAGPEFRIGPISRLVTTWSPWAPPDLDEPLFELRMVRDRLTTAERRRAMTKLGPRLWILGSLVLLVVLLGYIGGQVRLALGYLAVVVLMLLLLVGVLAVLGRVLAGRQRPGRIALSATRRGLRLTPLRSKSQPWHLIEGFSVKTVYGMDVVQIHPGESWKFRLVVSLTDWQGTAQELADYLEKLRVWVATAAFTTGEPPPAP